MTPKTITLEDWAKSKEPLCDCIEVHSPEQLGATINAVFAARLFVAKIDLLDAGFFRSWVLIVANQPAKNLLLVPEQMALKKHKGGLP